MLELRKYDCNGHDDSEILARTAPIFMDSVISGASCDTSDVDNFNMHATSFIHKEIS